VESHRQQCIDVLCGYLRLPYDPAAGLVSTFVTEETWPVGVADHLGRGSTSKETRTYQRLPNDKEVRLTIISTITAHLRKRAPISWQGLDFDFTGATFDGGNFGGATFSSGQARFVGAMFCGGQVNFEGATFTGGQVNFDLATFTGGQVNFDLATFSSGEVWSVPAFVDSRLSREFVNISES